MAGRLTIAHVLQWFELGGGESVALQLAGAQRLAGHDVHAVALSAHDGPLAAEFARRGVTVHRAPRWRDGFDPSLYPRLALRFARSRVDVVHTHDPQSLAYAAAPARLAGAVAVHTKHGEDVDTARRLWLIRGAALWLHALVAVSEETAAVARQAGEAPARKLRVIRNGVELARYVRDAAARSAVRAELGIPEQAWVVGAVGRLEPVKNHARLIRAAQPLLGERAQLVIVGDGSLRGALAAQVAALPPAARLAVHLPGLRRDVARLLSACDAFASSSDSEGLPLALLEAAAAALPIAATAVGGIASTLTDGETGLLVPVAGCDEAAIEADLRRALARLRDEPELARALAARARALVEREYSLARTAEAYLELYRAFR